MLLTAACFQCIRHAGCTSSFGAAGRSVPRSSAAASRWQLLGVAVPLEAVGQCHCLLLVLQKLIQCIGPLC